MISTMQAMQGCVMFMCRGGAVVPKGSVEGWMPAVGKRETQSEHMAQSL